MIATSGIHGLWMNSRLVFQHTLWERERKFLDFLLHSLVTQPAWVIMSLLPGNQDNRPWSMLSLHSCWKSRQNTLSTKWQILSPFLDSQEADFWQLRENKNGFAQCSTPLKSAASNSRWPPMSQSCIYAGWNFLLLPQTYSFPSQSKGYSKTQGVPTTTNFHIISLWEQMVTNTIWNPFMMIY